MKSLLLVAAFGLAAQSLISQTPFKQVASPVASTGSFGAATSSRNENASVARTAIDSAAIELQFLAKLDKIFLPLAENPKRSLPYPSKTVLQSLKGDTLRVDFVSTVGVKFYLAFVRVAPDSVRGMWAQACGCITDENRLNEEYKWQLADPNNHFMITGFSSQPKEWGFRNVPELSGWTKGKKTIRFQLKEGEKIHPPSRAAPK